MLLFLFAFAAAAVPLADERMTVRNAHTMVYDARRHVVVLFGGADEERVRGDTWEWGGQSWKRISDTGPAPRTFAAMTWDSARGVTLLFGGNPVLFGSQASTPKLFDDFWQWDGKRWTRLRSSGPPARAEAALSFDPIRKRAVLFGGYEYVGAERRPLGDTWEWDGERWTPAAGAGPSPRNGASMVYDRARAITVLFGGPPVTGAGFETWEWNGGWREASRTTEGRYNPVMAYDQSRRRVIRFGGWDGHQRTGDTWEYDGSTWARVATSGPPARNHSALVYDSRRKRAVLFGGHDGDFVFGDLWEWDGHQWDQRLSTAPRRRSENGH